MAVAPLTVSSAFEEGLAYELEGNRKQALRCLKLAAAQAPLDVRCLMAVGRIYLAMGKMAQATEWYLRAEGIAGDRKEAQGYTPTPGTLDADREWIEHILPQRVPDEALLETVAHLTLLLDHHGPDMRALRKLGLLYGRLSNMAAAQPAFAKAYRAGEQGLSWH